MGVMALIAPYVQWVQGFKHLCEQRRERKPQERMQATAWVGEGVRICWGGAAGLGSMPPECECGTRIQEKRSAAALMTHSWDQGAKETVKGYATPKREVWGLKQCQVQGAHLHRHPDTPARR